MNAIQTAVFVVLAALGLYFLAVVPLLTVNLNGLAFGIIFLAAAAVLLMVARRSRRGTPRGR